MAKELKKICILSGPSKRVDLSRAQTGINYHNSLEAKVPFRILGAGPDLGKALEIFGFLKRGEIGNEEYFERMDGLDHHLSLYRFLAETGETVETITNSVTLAQNVLYGFEGETEGKYAIVTEPWHYGKFEWVGRALKRKGKISPELEFFNVPSPDTGYYTAVQKMASIMKTLLELAKI